MLHILMGRARTGKSERVLQRIAALGDSSQQILLVPEHASHVAEMDLCRVCGDTASRHAEALTFKLLASRVLGICGDRHLQQSCCQSDGNKSLVDFHIDDCLSLMPTNLLNTIGIKDKNH